MTEKIVFIYNAKSGFLSELTDAVTKVLSPGSYSCDLCKITYGTLSMKSDWRDYLASLPQEKIFLHKDELVGEYDKYNKYELPTILLENESGVVELITAKDFKTIRTLPALIYAVKKQLI
jgi:hypothetical protein